MTEGSGEEVTVVVDVHEPDDLRMLSLGHPDVDNWKEAPLDAADYVVNGVGFERKTPSDYATSLLNDRLDEQVEKLKEVYEEAYILLEGGFDDFSSLPHTSINPESLRGHAASVTARHGIPVIPTGGATGTETAKRLLIDMTIRYGRKSTEEPTSGFIDASAVGSDEPLGVRLWACFDGIGPTLAERLHGELGPPTDFAMRSVSYEHNGLHPTVIDDFARVDGIGSERAERLIAQLQGREDVTPPDERGSAENDADRRVLDADGETDP